MIRLNIPFVLHFQAWSEERSEGAPFLIHDKVRNSLNVGGRFIQLNQSEGTSYCWKQITCGCS
jgi:hypothetical protein